MLEAGDRFPEFSLQDQMGNTWTLESLRGKSAVIYFYPKDDTSGCTIEACEFRDCLPDFRDTLILGVSPDGIKSHQKFIKKFDLNFTLLADENHVLAEACGIWIEKSMYGKKYMGVERTTYLLDEQGFIKKVWRKVTPTGHVTEVLSELQS